MGERTPTKEKPQKAGGLKKSFDTTGEKEKPLKAQTKCNRWPETERGGKGEKFPLCCSRRNS